MVGRFVESHPGWEPIRLPELERWEVPGHSGCYRVWPHLDPAAGGFAAALRCPSPADRWADRAVARSPIEKAPRTSRMRRGSRSAPGIGGLANPPAVPWGAWKDGDWLWFQRGDTLMVAPRASAEWETLRFSAMSVARKRGPDWQPSYGCGRAAQSLLDSYPMLELATDQAVSYVRGDSIPVSSRAAGWYIVHWQGRRLGWAKAAGGRLRNHFPKGLRQECPR
ncbi:MAG: hypothetical protein D6753_13720 [Planctomycetota bacterium]|nr:MAG: hypothetical protein D6753_13720 [Planctomycetota bacterium]